MTVVWLVVFGRLAALRHDRFGTFGFDLGIYDQATWLLAHFRDPFMTTRGIDVFGHHGTFILYLFAPGYWLGWGPRWLTFAGVLAQASGAIAVYLIARDVIVASFRRWCGVVLAAVYLLHPSSGWLVWEQFHPDTFSIAPLLFGYWAMRTQRWKLMWAMLVLAIICKEDMATAVVVFGIVLLARREFRRGAIAAGGAIAWYLAVNKLLIPWRNDGEAAFYTKQFFGDLGNSPVEVLKNLVLHPVRSNTATKLFGPDRRPYYWTLFGPSAVVVPFLRFDALMIGLPMLLINVISVQSFTYNYRYHYVALPLVGITAATIEAVGSIARRSKDRAWPVVLVLGLLTACTLIAYESRGIGPGSSQFRNGTWPILENESVIDLIVGIDPAADDGARARATALRALPADVGTSASYNLVAHVTDRAIAFEFPNPWFPKNWGIEDRHQRDPASIEYLYIDRALFAGNAEEDRAQDSLVEALLKSEFAVVTEQRVGDPPFSSVDVIVARRVRPPGCLENIAQVLLDRLGTAYSVDLQAGRACPIASGR